MSDIEKTVYKERVITIRLTKPVDTTNDADKIRYRDAHGQIRDAAKTWSGEPVPVFLLAGTKVFDKTLWHASPLGRLPDDIDAIRAFVNTTNGLSEVAEWTFFDVHNSCEPPRQSPRTAKADKRPADAVVPSTPVAADPKKLCYAHVVPPLRGLLSDEGLAECRRFAAVIDRYIPESSRDMRWLHTVIDRLPTGYPHIHKADVHLGGVLTRSLRHIADGNQVPRWMLVYGWPYALKSGRPSREALRSNAERILSYKAKPGEFHSNDYGGDRYLAKASGNSRDADEDMTEISF